MCKGILLPQNVLLLFVCFFLEMRGVGEAQNKYTIWCPPGLCAADLTCNSRGWCSVYFQEWPASLLIYMNIFSLL